MTKKKICKRCRMFYDGETCPGCSSNQSTNIWKGRIYILNPEKSEIAQKVGLKVKGEYAIKIR